MASSPSSTGETLDPSPNPQPELDNPSSQPNPTPSSTPLPPPPPPPNPNSNAPLISPPQSHPPSISYAPPPLSGMAAIPPTAPSFRPAAPIPQFSHVSIPNFQNPSVGVQPPGVGVSSVSPMFPLPGSVPQYMMPYQVPLGQPPNASLRTFAPMPNGYAAMPTAGPQGTMLPPVIPRYPSPYPAMVRPAFPRPPGAIGVLPAVPRPPIPGIPGVRPIIPTIVRPALLPSVAPAEKPQTTVYVGKIASTVENDFMDSLLKFCGPFKSWKRAENPTDGTPRGFGFCEFETAEGVLRALRLLSKFNIDGQELVLNVNQATREYLERYVEKKTQNAKKLNETQTVGAEKLDDSAPVVEKNEPPKPSEEDLDSKKDDNDSGNKENQDIANFGIVTDEDREADQEVLGKLTNMIEERLKAKPLPPPPARVAVDGSGNSNSEFPAKSRDGDSDVDVTRNDAAEDKNDDEIISDAKQVSEHDRTETSSPDRSRRYDRRSRDKERERDIKRGKEREIERYEREAERGRIKKERDQRRKIEDAEREYEERLKDWEYREREKEKQRQYEKEKEKERERKRKKEINYEEEDEEEDSRKKWRRSVLEEKRKKRLRDYEDDLADRQKEEEEISEANRRAEEEEQLQQQRDALKLLSNEVTNGNEKPALAEETTLESRDKIVEQDHEGHSGHENHRSDGISENGIGDESTTASSAVSDVRQSGNGPAKKLGFGLVGSGKRTAVPSVFHEEDEDAHKEKKMRPLVPIDYSTEELEAVQPSASGAPTLNLAAAAEFAKRISNPNSKEEKLDGERERSRRPRDRSSQRERDWNNEDANHRRDENKEKNLDRDKDRERGPDKLKTLDNKKLLDAKSKQLIDMIPRTKEELFSYDVNWAVYDKHELHERMRPWISKKITEFLGEEETTLVDYIVSSTQEHVKASQMLELLQSILDDEAERFVLIMWRMLIFEIKKVETGLSSRPKT